MGLFAAGNIVDLARPRGARVNQVEINGRAATAEQLGELAFAGYGHFTSMQLRDHLVRGLELHLERLARDSQELFGREVDRDRVLAYLRSATDGGPGDLSVQVNVFSRDDAGVEAGRAVDSDILVRTGPPAGTVSEPVSVRTTVHQRLLPHVKHVATLGLVYHWRGARRDGFDDVLFLDRDGFVSEGSIWNVGFFDGDGVVWPAAPALRGITMQLVQAGLRREGMPSTTRPVHVDELSRFRSAVLMNSIVPGRPLAAIDGVELPGDTELLDVVRRAYLGSQEQPLR
jgi:branched-subunit amino acid aminotransferase/4-amino-4-deoxychorismate lyase